MNVFADSSALAKRYVADENSEEFDQLLGRATNLTVSVLCLPEIVSALCRRRREKLLTPTQYRVAKDALESDFTDITVVQITDEIIVGSVRILEAHSLRASDAIHIASAQTWGAELFVSADERQCKAAKGLGLQVVRLG
jgi:predicted nucleic acid-binding protein